MHPNTLLLLLDLNTAIKQGAKTNIQITEKNYSSIRRNNLSTERGILRLYTVNNCLSRTRPIPADTDTHLHNTCQSGHIQEEHTMNPNALCGKCTYLWKKSQENLIPKLNRFSATPPPTIPADDEQQLHQQEAHFFDTGVLLNISFWNLHFGNLHIFRLLPGRSSRAGKRLFNKSMLHTPFNVIVMRFETKWLGRLYCSIQQPSQTIPSDEFEPTGTDDELEWRLIFLHCMGTRGEDRFWTDLKT